MRNVVALGAVNKTTTVGVSEAEVAEFLQNTPQFFCDKLSLLETMSVPHPKSGSAVSLLERQIYQLRDKKETLQTEVNLIKEIAGDNGALLTKIQTFSVALMSACSEQEAVDVILNSMREVFNVKHVTFLSWEMPKKAMNGIRQLGISPTWSENLKTFLSAGQPVCGLTKDDWQAGLFTHVTNVKSVCALPLGHKRIWGVLALGADTERFSDELGTHFLSIISDLITARLQRLF